MTLADLSPAQRDALVAIAAGLDPQPAAAQALKRRGLVAISGHDGKRILGWRLTDRGRRIHARLARPRFEEATA
jgi:hypothetical protein